MLLQKHAVGIAVDKEMAPKFNGLIYNYIFMMTSEFTNKTKGSRFVFFSNIVKNIEVNVCFQNIAETSHR